MVIWLVLLACIFVSPLMEFAVLIIFCWLRSKDLPSSFADAKGQANTVDKQPDQTTTKDASAMDMQANASKTSIDNNPSCMIYAKTTDTLATRNDEESDKKGDSLWRLPNTTSIRRFWWAFTWPIKLVLSMTIPNPKTFRYLYPLTFMMCIIWIGVNAYLIVWMVTIIGMLIRWPIHIRQPKRWIQFFIINSS